MVIIYIYQSINKYFINHIELIERILQIKSVKICNVGFKRLIGVLVLPAGTFRTHSYPIHSQGLLQKGKL